MNQKNPHSLNLTPLGLATDEEVLSEIVRRASGSELHALVIASCRPYEKNSVKLQVHVLAGSMQMLDLLMSSVNDAVAKRKSELKDKEE